jgi:hypothetical protein
VTGRRRAVRRAVPDPVRPVQASATAPLQTSGSSGELRGKQALPTTGRQRLFAQSHARLLYLYARVHSPLKYPEPGGQP